MDAAARQSISSYLGRFTVYGLAVVSASIGGSEFTSLSDAWGSPGVTGALWTAVFSLGPAIVIVAAVPLSMRASLLVASLLAGWMLVMWWQFSMNDSSTSALVFVAFGWGIGAPAALGLLLVSVVRTARRQGPRRRAAAPGRPVPS